MKTTMTTETEAQMQRRSIALRFGTPMSTGTTTATLVYATLVAVGTILAFAGTMFVLAELSAWTALLLVAGAVVLAAAFARLRPRVRTPSRPKPRPRRAA